MIGSTPGHPDRVDLREILVPVRAYVFENQAELALVSGPQRSRGNRLDIDVRVTSTNEGKRESFDVRG